MAARDRVKFVATAARSNDRDMIEFLKTPTAQVIVWTVVGCMLFAVAYFVVSKARGLVATEDTNAAGVMANFSEMRARGELSEDEYRKVKTMLSKRLQQELKSTNKEG